MARRDEIRPLPSAERLRELLRYDADTGELRWRVSRARTAKAGQVAGSMNRNGYRQLRVDGAFYRAHRLIWKLVTGTDPAEFIDHVNGDKADNRWANLREATFGKNKWNSTIPKNNKSGFKGVFWQATHQRWRASLDLGNKKHRHLGYFSSPEDAAAVWERAAQEQRGEFFRAC